MLVVLMALIEMGRSKVHKATRWFWMVLSGGLFVAPVGCETSKDADTGIGGNDSGEVTSDVPQVLYGPVQDTYEGVSPDVFEVPQVLYGPPPSDVAPEVESDVPQVLYGPPPDMGPVDDVPAQDVAPDCEPVAYYGPKPCDSDEECVKDFGEGWYCDKENAFADPCGGEVKWPVCKQGSTDVIEPDAQPADAYADCGPAGWYGPPPCQSDEECAKQHGADFYCNKDNVVESPCGDVKYPVCEQRPAVDVPPADATQVDCGEPMTFYGPPPCTSDEQCQKDYGPDWYCDKSDPCMPDWCKQK